MSRERPATHEVVRSWEFGAGGVGVECTCGEELFGSWPDQPEELMEIHKSTEKRGQE